MALPSLAEEQTALHLVATLVAQGAPPATVFAAVAEEAGRLVSADIATIDRFDPDDAVTVVAVLGAADGAPAVGSRTPTAETGNSARVHATGRPARTDRYTAQLSPVGYRSGFRAAVSVPIVVDGHLWGAMTVGSKAEDQPFPRGTEERLAHFTELVAIAIANAQAQEELEAVADEQAALRRVATLVAEGALREEAYAAVAEEVGRHEDADVVVLLRYDADDVATVVGWWGMPGIEVALGERMRVGGEGVAVAVARTHRPAYVGHLEGPPGSVAAWLVGLGIQSGIGTPIVVEDQLWGVMVVASRRPGVLPAGSEARTAEFTDLVATAIANGEGRAALAHLANEQAALRRVATLVAKAASPSQVFAAVAEEVGRLTRSADVAFVARYGPSDTIELLGGWSRGLDPSFVGDHRPLGGTEVSTLVRERGAPARVDHIPDTPMTAYARQWARCAAGAPIAVGGRLWGVMVVGSMLPKGLPPGIEHELADFTELTATAIANADAQEELHALAEQQAALRRVATLVAEAAEPTAVFAAVAEEVGRLLSVESVVVSRYEGDDTVTMVAGWGAIAHTGIVGQRFSFGEGTMHALIRETGHAARIDRYPDGPQATASGLGIRFAVGAPITVEGRLWGAISIPSLMEAPPADTEERLSDFTQLVATAIVNAQFREELTASRARIVTSADDERRRIVRDLHDAAQQRLVHTVITLKLAQRAQQAGDEQAARGLVDEALDHAEHANTELRELVHGILPSILSRGGLAAGVAELTTRLRVPVDVRVTDHRFPAAVEAAAYFVIAEALTNVAKHSRADSVHVSAEVVNSTLRLEIQDDGVGGARLDGSGLRGLADRTVALGGELRIESPDRAGTRVIATLPLPD